MSTKKWTELLEIIPLMKPSLSKPINQDVETSNTPDNKIPQTTTQIQDIPSKIKGLKISHCSSMRGWQNNVFNLLKKGRTDVYIVAQPGAGKTLPYICYWVDLLGLNPTLSPLINSSNFMNTLYNIFLSPDKLPKLLIAVPTRTLNANAFEEFRGILLDILIQCFDYIREGLPYHLFRLHINHIFAEYINQTNLNQLLDQRDKLFNELNNNYSDPDKKIISNKIKQIDSNIEQIIGSLILFHIKSKLICLKTGAIDQGHPKVAPVIISIYESCTGFINNIINDVKLLIVDEAHLIQRNNEQDRSAQIIGHLYPIFKKLRNDTRIVYLSGTQNPESAREYGKYSQKCFNRSLYVESVAAGNPA